jgi:hypothetical protein
MREKAKRRRDEDRERERERESRKGEGLTSRSERAGVSRDRSMHENACGNKQEATARRLLSFLTTTSTSSISCPSLSFAAI